MAKPKVVVLRCHQCGNLYVSKLGGDLTCTPECATANVASRKDAIEKLEICGFVQSTGILNLWEKGGVHISLDQVMREGIGITIERHSNALAEIHH